jgi:DNA helicase II / ATP-dependent DNA helicase PcrA
MKFTQEQSAIIESSTDDDLLVIAGAGSGKTSTMTNRIVALVEKGVPQDSILGLTFTKKAASELFSKVSSTIATKGNDNGWDCDATFLKPEVQTYDAFFQSIVRQYGLLVGMQQSVQPLTEAGSFQLAARVVQEHMDLVFSSHAADMKDELLGKNVSDGNDTTDSYSFNNIVQQVLDLSRACSNAMINRDCLTFEDAVQRVRAWDEACLRHVDDLIGDQRIGSKAPTVKSMSLPKKPGKTSKISIEDKLGQMRQNRLDFRLYQADRLRNVIRQRERLLTLAQYYQNAKSDCGMAEFSDFALAAFQLVTRFPAIGATYRRRFTHVFLDEYQDTSTTQALLLFALFHPHRTGDKAVVEGNEQSSSVTAVGDPFQSIYAWRGASPGAFKTFQREFDMDPLANPSARQIFGKVSKEPLTLSQTFRNSRLVLDAANLLTAPLRMQTASHQERTSAQFEEVEVDQLSPRVNADEGTLALLGYETSGQEVDGVVRFVQQAVSIYGKSDAGVIDKNAPHVAVLFRSKTSIRQYQEALTAAGLQVEVVGYSALFDRPEIMDLLALLRVISDHTDSDSLLHLLASPRFGVTPGDLSALADMTHQLNKESQYRALVEAGIAPKGLHGSAMMDQVKKHRHQLHTGVFLIDILLRDDITDVMSSSYASNISERGRYLLLKASQILTKTQSQASAPLRQAVLAAIQALDLDVDLLVSQALHEPINRVDVSSAKASLRAFLDQVDAYAQELPQGVSADLSGFVAWIDAMQQSPQESNTAVGTHADVVLMTIHQAKGLEWDAVAVVGMKKDTFPSNQGDSLSIQEKKEWDFDSLPMTYESRAKTWLEDPTAVPVPVRADCQILPQFPHDSSASLSIQESLSRLTLTSLEDEVFGQLREFTGFVDDTSVSVDHNDGELVLDEKAVPDYLTQPQEYGRRLHKDERRLAYVALTRAKHDLLVTFSVQSSNLDPSLLIDPSLSEENTVTANREEDSHKEILKNASIFWKELEVGFSRYSNKCDAGSSWLKTKDESIVSTRVVPLGYIVGHNAELYEKVVVSQALEEAPKLTAQSTNNTGQVWPVVLSSRIHEALSVAAEQVETTKQENSSNHNSLYAHALTLLTASSGRLGVQGDLLVHDAESLKNVGRQVISSKAQSVTSIQAMSGTLGSKAGKQYWRSIVRPIPQVTSPLAQAGTIFHAWAADFLLPQTNYVDGLIVATTDGSTQDGFDNIDGKEFSNRNLLLQQLEIDRNELRKMATQSMDESSQAQIEQRQHLVTWKQHLTESMWAQRDPVWVERPIVANISGQIVKGKLDAVFAGGIDEHDEMKRYTIVDWKTGRKPVSADECEMKLAQLDLYRLLLSRKENIALDSIDACLYYVSEDNSSQRMMKATTKSEQEIKSRILSGLPEQSDND